MPYHPQYLVDISENAKTVTTYPNNPNCLKEIGTNKYIEFAERVLHGKLIAINDDSFAMRITRQKPDGGYKSAYQFYYIEEWLSNRDPIRSTILATLLLEFDVKQPREKRKSKRSKLR